jgi:hypothetical protein
MPEGVRLRPLVRSTSGSSVDSLAHAASNRRLATLSARCSAWVERGKASISRVGGAFPPALPDQESSAGVPSAQPRRGDGKTCPTDNLWTIAMRSRRIESVRHQFQGRGRPAAACSQWPSSLGRPRFFRPSRESSPSARFANHRSTTPDERFQAPAR